MTLRWHTVRRGGNPGPGTALRGWNPENRAQWESFGRDVAYRNLWVSIPCLMLAFAVWMVWSVIVVHLPQAGFNYTTSQLFWLAALPGLSGATLRLVFSFMVPLFGGRRWTTLSTAALLIPALGIGIFARNPETPYWVMGCLAILCGLGAGNFASSIANISFFFPRSEKGTAMGLNAGLGNLGVSVAQFVVPIVITVGVFGVFGGAPTTGPGQDKQLWLQNAGLVWVPFVLVAALAAWFWMDDIVDVRASVAEQARVLRDKHSWIMSWLYLGTFGSFVGYSAGFPLLMSEQFPTVDPGQYVFLGPLVGALMRPVGGWMADRWGGARVTFWTFLVMTLALLGLIGFIPGAAGSGSFWGFFLMFMVLFITAGVGNGSTFRMIPSIFLVQRLREASGEEARRQAELQASKQAGTVLGFSSAFAAYGAFVIPQGYGASIGVTGSPVSALWVFTLFYFTCIGLTWWYYSRRFAEVPC
ncbi:MAG: NarK family nitrate/nitrite MFS transporter [Ectothiorhodospiraceae bacterium]|nr:NarK family nitrate/nitrite MFS transporter [Ectothiorhodospiraceae bacterium]